jgi:N-acetyl-gamma-glutamyl-phosphate reductase
MAKSSVAVVGATGYGGAEIVRLLNSHPCAEVTTVTSSRSAGKPIAEECPWLSSHLILEAFEPEKLEADVVFLCQESGFAMQHAPALSKRARVIDLSADFRLTDMGVYTRYYRGEHTSPNVRGVYGMPELVDRNEIEGANLVANPGCYPTAILLGLMPLVKAGLVKGTPVVDAKSGVSGAGRSRKETEYLFTELDGGFKAYAVDGHRHTPEVEQMAGFPIRFTPHLVPMPRGILATLHVPVSSFSDLEGLYRQFYAGAKFVRVVDKPPSTKQVVGSNRCDIYVASDERTGFAVICSAIDNLVKGAAGQAIQNMNLMLGLPEETGLPMDGVWP